MNEKFKHFLFDKPNSLFMIFLNISINIAWVFLLGYFINKSIKNTLIIIGVWTLSLTMGKAKHYKSPLKCFLMQVLFFSAIFLSIKINIYVAIVFTVYTKFLLSGHADIEDDEAEISDKPSFIDFTLWKPHTDKSVYQPLIDYLKYNALTAENHPIGKYLITTNGHITACVDGYIIDTWDCTNKKIEYIWKI